MRIFGTLVVGLLLCATGAPAEPVPAGPAPGPAPAATPPPPAKPPTKVYGLELEKRGRTDRLLIFAEDALVPRIEEPDADTVVLVLPGAALDASAPTRITPKVGKGVSRVLAFEPADAARPEVRVVIRRGRNVEPTLSQRGSIVALEFERPPGAAITLDVRETEIAEIVRDVAEVTGAEFIFDEKLRGRVSIVAEEDLDAGAALEVLTAALLLEGFAVVPTPGGPQRILPVEQVPGAAPWRSGEPGDGEAVVTTLLHLEAADPDAVVAALQPRIAGGGLALAYPPSNSVILAGKESALARWIRLARSLDTAARRELRVLRLRHATAGEVAGIVGELAAKDPGQRGQDFAIWPDPRTNAVVLRGAPARLDEAAGWIAQLDHPAASGARVDVIPLHHADPESFAALPASLAAAGPRGAGEESLAGRTFQLAVDPATRSLIVAGDAETRSLVGDLVRAVDRQPPQIGVELSVMELSMSDSLELSFDGFLPFTTPDSPGQSTGAITLNPSGGGFLDPRSGSRNLIARATREPLLIPVVDPSTGVPTTFLVPRETAVVTADGRTIRSRLISRPRLLMAAGQEHSLFAGDNIPIPVARASDNPLAIDTTVERQDVGLELKVRPTAGEKGGVRLEIRLETSAVAESLAGDVEEVGVTLRKRRLETTVHLQDGQVAVIATQEQPIFQSRITGTPWLKDFPIVGQFFRNVQEQTLESYLVITAEAWIDRGEGTSGERRVAAH